MGYDRGDSFSFDFEPNGIPFSSKSKIKLSSRSYPLQLERKWKYSFPSAGDPYYLTPNTPGRLEEIKVVVIHQQWRQRSFHLLLMP